MNSTSSAVCLLSVESVLRRPTGSPRDEPRERHQGRPGECSPPASGYQATAGFLNNAIILFTQSEQKKFLQQHKTRSETYSKAAATMKKQRKKSRGASKSGLAMDKELKNMQILEEEKSKLDAFCEQSLKNVSMQWTRS